MDTYTSYRLALATNEEARQRAAVRRLIKEHRSESKFTKALHSLFAKQPSQKRRNYGLQ